jgi:hypothetical protein
MIGRLRMDLTVYLAVSPQTARTLPAFYQSTTMDSGYPVPPLRVASLVRYTAGSPWALECAS